MRKSTLILVFAATLWSTGCDNQPKENNTEETSAAADTLKQNDDNTTEKESEAKMAEESDSTHFGEMIQAEGAVSMEEFAVMMENQDTLNVKIEAVASDVCQKKGCWMKVQTIDGSSMRIRFKDYGFFVPKNLSGKEVVFEGIAYRDTISIEDLKHYAEDEGKAEEEIAAITEPEIKTAFLANGVLIK